MANNINVIQNQPASLRQLAAQRVLYSGAKALASVQAGAGLMTPLIITPIASSHSVLKPWGALIGLSVALIDLAILEPVIRGRTRAAAAVQEIFDTSVLEIPWNSYLSKAPDPELWSTSRTEDPTLKDWYPKVEPLPLASARILCQRTNCWWDGKLRRRYATALYGLAGLMFVTIIGVGLAQNISMADFVLTLLAPTFPALAWSLKEARRQWDAANTVDRLKGAAVELWHEMLSEKLGETQAERRSRQLQDVIFGHRSRSPLIFNWVYRLLRRRYETQMSSGADQLLTEAKSAGII